MAVQEGIKVIVATGKARGPWVSDVFARLNLENPCVFLQGLLIYDSDWNILYENKMSANVASEIVSFAKHEGLTHMIYSNDRILCEETDEHTNRMIGYGEPIPEAVGPLSEVLGKVPVHKVMYAASDEQLDRLRPALESRLAGRVTVVKALHGFHEILPPGTSKGRGVKWVLDRLGLDPSSLVALGDGENDIEMLQLAGLGVAMGNASAQVKGVADFVTCSNNDDGVALVIEQLVDAKRQLRNG